MTQPQTFVIPEDFDQRFERAFGLLAFITNRQVVDHMRRISIDLKMDTESVLIWGKRIKAILSAVTLGVILIGCSSAPPRVPDDFPRLILKADEANTLVFSRQNLQLGKYKKVYVAPVLVQIANEQNTRDISDEEANKLARYAEWRLKESLAKRMTLVNRPAADVLSVRFRILDIEPTSKAQIAMFVPPFAMINMLSPKGAFLGSITLAGELYEGDAREPSVAFVGTRSRPGIDATVAFQRWAVAEIIIDNAAERLASDLENESLPK